MFSVARHCFEVLPRSYLTQKKRIAGTKGVPFLATIAHRAARGRNRRELPLEFLPEENFTRL